MPRVRDFVGLARPTIANIPTRVVWAVGVDSGDADGRTSGWNVHGVEPTIPSSHGNDQDQTVINDTCTLIHSVRRGGGGESGEAGLSWG